MCLFGTGNQGQCCVACAFREYFANPTKQDTHPNPPTTCVKQGKPTRQRGAIFCCLQPCTCMSNFQALFTARSRYGTVAPPNLACKITSTLW